MHDWWIALVVMLKGEVSISNKAYVLYRRHSNNVSQTGNDSEQPLVLQLTQRIHLWGSEGVNLKWTVS